MYSDNMVSFLKIIQFIPTLTNGGGEVLVRDYAIALKEKGHDVRIVVTHSSPDFSNEKIVRKNKIPIVSIEPPFEENQQFVQKFAATVYRCWSLITFLNAEKPDILHVHLTILHIVHLCHNFIPRRTKIVYTCHSVPEIYFEKYKKEFGAVKYFLKRGNFSLIALHEEASIQCNQIFKCSDTKYLYNMINLERFRHPIVSRKDMRLSLGIPQEAFVIGHVGRFTEVKNHDFLIEVFAAVIKEKSDAFLLMIGDGVLRAHIEARLNRMGLGSRYLILSNRYDIPELDQMMDVYVFPSKHEGFPISLLEAQACGIKCVCSDNIPAAVFLNENVYTLSLEDSVEKWKNAVLYNQMPVNRSTGRLEDYDTRTIIKKLEQIYEE